jgi:hypothetical protein
MPDAAQPDIFTLAIQFTNGANKSWQIKAPTLPITEGWIKDALTYLIIRITSDLRYGHSQPESKPDRQAFQEFDRHSEALVADMHAMISTWAKWRIDLYRKTALPAWKFQEDPDADTGKDTEWRPPMAAPGEPTPEGY